MRFQTTNKGRFNPAHHVNGFLLNEPDVTKRYY